MRACLSMPYLPLVVQKTSPLPFIQMPEMVRQTQLWAPGSRAQP